MHVVFLKVSSFSYLSERHFAMQMQTAYLWDMVGISVPVYVHWLHNRLLLLDFQRTEKTPAFL